MKNQTPMLIIVLSTIAILIGGILLLSKGDNSTTSGAKVDEKILFGKNSHQTGPKNAKATIVEFGDYECPACAYYHEGIEQIIKEYKGKVNYVFRHFPLPQHEKALIAAEAAEAAASQGKFFEMHNLLYQNQKNWVESKNSLSEFLTYAKSLKLDTKKFENDVKNNKFDSKISADLQDGSALRIDATPAFFINSVKFEGNPTYQELKTKIDSLLQ